MTSIAAILDNAGSITGQIQHQNKSDDDSLELSGSSNPNETIRIYQNGTFIGETTADSSGQWSYTANQLSEGSHSFTASSVDTQGVESLPSSAYVVNVDQTAVVASDLQIEGISGLLQSGGSTNNGRVNFSGKAEENARIDIYDNGQLIGSTQADANGLWQVNLDLPDGQHDISTVVVDEAGNSSPASNAISLEVDSNASVQNSVNTLSTPPEVILPPGVPIQNGGFTNDNTPVIRGTATPNATVTVSVNGDTYGPFNADNQGNWELQITTPLPEGEAVFRARAVNSFGESYSAYSLTIDTEASPAPIINDAVDDVGLYQGDIDSGSTTDDNEITLQGTGTPGEFITVYDGGTFLGATNVQPDGTWTFTPNAPLDDGVHNITTYTIDAAGNTSTESSGFEVTIDTSAEVPVITHLVDDQGSGTGNIQAGETTDDPLPEVVGTAEPDAKITISLNGQVLSEVTADDQGNWSYQLTDELTSGTHTFTATQVDPAGNESAPSVNFEFEANVNASPIANDDSFTVNGVATLDVLANDSDPDNDTLSVTRVVSQGNHGTAHINQSGELVYTPNGQNSNTVSDTLTYEVSDGKGGVATATVTLQVLPPIAEPTIDLIASSDSGKFDNDNITNDTTPTFTGTASAGSTVVLFGDGIKVGETVADSNGQWTITSSQLTDDAYSFHVESSDGNVSRSSPSLSVYVDTVVDASVDLATNRFNNLSDLRFDITTNEQIDYTIEQTNTPWSFGWQFLGWNQQANITATGSTSTNVSVGADDTTLNSQGRFNFNATLTDLAGNQKSTALNSVIIDPIASLADGGYIVTYLKLSETAEDGFDVFAQRYDAQGNPHSESFKVNSFTEGDQVNSDVIGLADGGYVITWQSRDQDGDLNGIYAQRYDENNQAVGPETQINVYTDSNQQSPSISDLPNGGYVISWMSHGQDGSGEGVYMRVFDAAGEAISGDVRVSDSTIGHQANPSITTLSDGRFIVSWDAQNANGIPQATAKLFDSEGNALSAEFSLSDSSNPQFQTHISATADGGFAVSWLAVSQDNEAQVMVQRYDHNGSRLLNDAIVVHSSENAFSAKPEVAGLNNGDIVVTWTAQDGDQLGVFASRYSADGNAIYENRLINHQEQGVQTEPHIVALEDGGYLITWGEQQTQNGRASVWGQQFDAEDNATGPAFEVGQVTASADTDSDSQAGNLLGDDDAIPSVVDSGEPTASTAAENSDGNNDVETVVLENETGLTSLATPVDLLPDLNGGNGFDHIDLSDVFIDADFSFNRSSLLDSSDQISNHISTQSIDAFYQASPDLAELLGQHMAQQDLDII
ncbi:Ig-like domain-containing protein [Pseudoteredinibacter isoporae]|uniref:VCBS repeat-containing protein n=1 Tax=Pseudoteredinibacter isoporae TaxID=570281 RepID=A0A7X0JWG9_9GAMM|nr:Ig-like domain-containing protein [Pseudoteredinibacter isoporae]MBB6523477.1 VCBS repeat-containing protein [Pseudoteredinibacter isoporae]NHO88986.1 cadherin-like domain-containing protein [Pseudoteredinibacter isoporae]NIB24306.1 cadherin-like domain-containing protein [Pseudoteredinibacter isoporae]